VSDRAKLFRMDLGIRFISLPFPRLVIGVESKEIGHRLSKSTGHPFQLLERRCVPSTFNQAQKVDGDANKLCEVLLRPAGFVANLADTDSELFP